MESLDVIGPLGNPGAQGGDWGASISPELGRIDPGHVVGDVRTFFRSLRQRQSDRAVRPA